MVLIVELASREYVRPAIVQAVAHFTAAVTALDFLLVMEFVAM